MTFPYGINEFNVRNGVVYASSYDNAFSEGNNGKDGICCINNDGSGLRQIYTGKPTEGFQLIDKQLYFEKDILGYCMDLDGKCKGSKRYVIVLYAGINMRIS